MKHDTLGPILIHRPRRQSATAAHPYVPGELMDHEYNAPIDPFKPGKRMVKKVQRIDPATGLMREVEIGKKEPGLSFGPLGVNLGTTGGRREQALAISDALTPEISEVMKANGLEKGVELLALAPKVTKYAAAETVAMSAAQLALPGLGLPVLGPLVLGSRAYRAIYDKRTDFEFFVKSDGRNDTFRNRLILAGANVGMLPFDIATSMTSRVAAFGLNFLAGKTLLNKIPGALTKLDPKLEGLKPIDDGLSDKILNTVDNISNLLTFGQPTVTPKAA